jgi:DNA-binding MarR family transcriptional regulator
VSDDADAILRSIRRIVKRVSEHSRNLSRDVGLTVPQLLCLRVIGDLDEREAEVTVAVVATRVQLGAPTVSRIVDRLERAGLVVRERRAADRRKVCLSLTPGGVERFQSLPKPLQDRFVHRFGELTSARRAELLGALQEVITLMEADDVVAAPVLSPGVELVGDHDND